jgi:hypothetical protein
MAKQETPPLVYDPRGVVEAESVPLTERPRSLKGLRLGVLDNTKWNARKLLEETTRLLDAEFGLAGVNHYKKENFSVAASPELIARIAAENDFVLTAVGD